MAFLTLPNPDIVFKHSFVLLAISLGTNLRLNSVKSSSSVEKSNHLFAIGTVSLLAGRERFEDLAISSTCKAETAGNAAQVNPKSLRICLGVNLSGGYLLYAFNGILRTLLHSPSGTSHTRVSMQ